MTERWWENEYSDEEVLEILKAQREWTVLYADGTLVQIGAGTISGGGVRHYGKQMHFESSREAIIYGARELLSLGVMAPPNGWSGSGE